MMRNNWKKIAAACAAAGWSAAGPARSRTRGARRHPDTTDAGLEDRAR